jgi:hypothetical protein
MAADFSRRTQSADESDFQSKNGPTSLPPTLVHNSNETSGNHVHNGNGNLHAINNNSHNESSSTEATSLPENGFHSNKDDGAENGNENEDISDGQHLSTSDRRKVFEHRSQSTQEGSTISNGSTGSNTSPSARNARVTVAERLKMYQQNANNGTSAPEVEAEVLYTKPLSSSPSTSQSDMGSEIDLKNEQDFKKDIMTQSTPQPTSLSSMSKERDFCPAPIAKPERKFTPPKQDPKCQEAPGSVASMPTKSSSHKRIDTVFGKATKD